MFPEVECKETWIKWSKNHLAKSCVLSFLSAPRFLGGQKFGKPKSFQVLLAAWTIPWFQVGTLKLEIGTRNFRIPRYGQPTYCVEVGQQGREEPAGRTPVGGEVEADDLLVRQGGVGRHYTLVLLQQLLAGQRVHDLHGDTFYWNWYLLWLKLG